MDNKNCAGCLRHGEENVADAWCSDCSELVCKPCAKVHKRFDPPHKVVPPHEVKDLNESLLHTNKYCHAHSDQKLVLFCTQHDKMICDTCLSEAHANCQSVILMERAAKGVKNGTALEDLQKRMTNLGQIFTSVIREKDENSVSLDKQRKDILQHISDIRCQLDTHLNKLENEVKGKLDVQYNTQKTKIETDKNDLERLSTNIQKMIKDAAALKKSASEVHFFQVLKLLDEKIHREEIEIQHKNISSYLEFKTNDNISKFAGILQSLGEVIVKSANTTIQIPVEKVMQSPDLNTKEKVGKERTISMSADKVVDDKETCEKSEIERTFSSSADTMDVLETKRKVEKEKTSNLSAEKVIDEKESKGKVGKERPLSMSTDKVIDEKETKRKVGKERPLSISGEKVIDEKDRQTTGALRHIHSFKTSTLRSKATACTGCFISNKKILVADESKPFQYVCNYDGTEVETIQLKHTPWSVAMIDSSHTIVTLQENGFQILDVTSRTLGKCVKPAIHGCYGMTVKNGKIWVEDVGNKIYNIAVDGKVMREITTKYSPWDLIMNDGGDLYYTASENNSIQVITAHGQEMTYFSNPDLQYPRGIDIDYAGNVYVAGEYSNNVLKISPDGKIHHVILGVKNGIKSPWGLCYNKDTDEILIANNSCSSIEIYKV